MIYVEDRVAPEKMDTLTVLPRHILKSRQQQQGVVMKAQELPSQETINQLFRYDASTGLLYRKIARGGQCKNQAITGNDGRGYVAVKIDSKTYKAHRIIWKMHHNTEPEEIDHIDRNPQNNRIENLRGVTKSQNQHNARMRLDNSSGVSGVCWNVVHKKWQSRIQIEGANYELGMYDCKALAGMKYMMKKDCVVKAIGGEK